jgi:transcription elongation factor SPT6
VYEPNADPTGQTVGGQLIIDEKHRYSDLDELIVTHVQACARRVEDLMNHERFKPGNPDDLREHVLLRDAVLDMLKFYYRFILKELCCCSPRQEYVWFHP